MLRKDDKIGDYHLVEFLGRGQYGEVWLAEKQLGLSTRRVRHALKFLFNDNKELDLQAAESEIDTWIQASGHPNVMSVIDMLVYEGEIVIVSEFADGGSLETLLQNNDGKSASEEEALEMLRGILAGIEYLHSKNVVHRDLKPDNILLQGNFPRITDFGISRIISEGKSSTKAVGSPTYMSPESIDGDKSGQADIWAAGVILYEMLTGEYPFSSETVYGIYVAIQNMPIQPLPETVSPEIKNIVGKALEKDRRQRYQTALEMRKDVEQTLYHLKTRLPKNNIPAEIPEPEEQPQIDFAAAQPLSNEFSQDEINADHFEISTTAADVKRTRAIDAVQTDEKYIEQLTDWRKSELDLSTASGDRDSSQYKIDNNAVLSKPESNNKLFKLFGGIGAGFVLVILAGGLIWTVSQNFSDQTALTNKKPPKVVQQSPSPTPVIPAKPVTPKIPGMAYVSGGEFMMGRDDGVSPAEKPIHKVSVHPFMMDIYEVTNEKYAEFVKAVNYRSPTGWKNGAYPPEEANFPIVGVNWDDAVSFAKWAGKRLPTEEEWEFAARGTTNFIYPWGNDWEAGKANVLAKNFVEVGTFSQGASPFGIYDLSGNAWEWTASDFKPYPNGQLPNIFAGKTDLKTIRGGSFEAAANFATTTYRIGWSAGKADNYSRTSFRCVMDVNQ